MKGRRPKPVDQHHIDGTFNVTRHTARNEPQVTGRPIKPRFLKGRASKIWDDYFAIAYWLTSADSHSLAIWCSLAAESEKGSREMVSSRISVMRSLGSELGLNGPISRTRINVLATAPASERKEDELGDKPGNDHGDKYFN